MPPPPPTSRPSPKIPTGAPAPKPPTSSTATPNANTASAAAAGGGTNTPRSQSNPTPGSSSSSSSSSTAAGAAASQSTGRNLATVKVRNVQSSLMYHLMFDGDIGALTGAQLRQHVEAVSGIPANKQILSLSGNPIGSMTTGADVGLRNGSTLVLEVSGSSVRQMDSLSSAQPQPREPLQSGGAHLNNSNSVSRQQQQPVQQNRRAGENNMPPLPPTSSSYKPSSAGHFQHEERGMSSPVTHYDDMDVVVDIVEESDAPAMNPDVGPGFVQGDAVAQPQFRRTAADVEEMRLQQQEYVWKLEQVRFETERLNREREMKRQLMELEYEASLLDRDRVEMERHTAMEKQKLGHVAAQNRLEMDILQKFFPGAQQNY